MVKDQYRFSEGTKKVSKIKFGISSHHELERQAVIPITSKDLYVSDPVRRTVPNGVLDKRLGISSKDGTCGTCGKNYDSCIGHFGYIDLPFPVFHIGFFGGVIQILQTICKNPLCARVLLSPEDMDKFRRMINRGDLSYITRKKTRKLILEKAKKVSMCPHCGVANGIVKKSVLKVTYEKYRNLKKDNPLRMEKLAELDEVVKHNREVIPFREYILTETLNPQQVLNLLEQIPLEDVTLLMMRPGSSLPRDLILTRIAVPPACIRPSVVSETKAGTTEDDLTTKLSEIVMTNKLIAQHLQQGAKAPILAESWDMLQLHAALYINSQTSATPINLQQQSKKPSKGIVQRLKGKGGRFRQHLSGKRVNYTARTVISPDPNLRIEEVGIPITVAMTLTYPERVNPTNRARLEQLVLNGPDVHPGANFVEKKRENIKISLKFAKRNHVVNQLQDGDIVARHLCDGDIVLFNRQPSLHKLSIMCHRAKILPHRTFRFNVCVCGPYNADFDGDEMNLHVPQNEEARAEAVTLMANVHNLVTPKNGELIIGPTQDFITGAFMLTQRDTLFDKRQAMRLACTMLAAEDLNMDIDLPPPCIVKPGPYWSGKQIFSMIMKPNKKCKIKANLRTKGKWYTRDEEMCYKDSFVLIHNSELLSGSMDKSTMGTGGKNNIFHVLKCDWGETIATAAMWRLSRLASDFLMNRGFSIGLGDVTPSANLVRIKEQLLEEGNRKYKEYEAQMKNGTLPCQPGFSMEETLESKILGELSAIRDRVGNACLEELPWTNAPLIMALCGSKGSKINISQMIACVGQQAINGKRAPDGFLNRSLPHFEHKCKSPAAKGFVKSSFRSGLDPTEFFFHCMAGREGLVDTAVKTAETGYLQRRMVKALEDLCVNYDNTVRNADGHVLQFLYGDDGLDPVHMEGQEKPMDFDRVYTNVRNNYPCRDEEPLKPDELREISADLENNEEFNACNDMFKDDLKQFLEDETKAVDETLKSLYAGMVCYGRHRVTRKQAERFIDTCMNKYMESRIEPGTAVGAICSQSIGEPATQMTLKTFHFAGVASMNITQGVPRMNEILNCSKKLSTPIITAYLENDTDEDFAREVKARIEKTTLLEVCSYMEDLFTKSGAFLMVKLDMDRVKLLRLNVNIESIVQAIYKAPIGIKRDARQVNILDSDLLSIECIKENLNMELQTYRDNLHKVVIQGVPGVDRAVIEEQCIQGVTRYRLQIDGDNLRDVLATPGIKVGDRKTGEKAKTTCNSIHAVAQTLGIEAARVTILNEIKNVMEHHGITVDVRHMIMAADVMTSKGQPYGVTRFGLAEMSDNVMNLASFEKTADHLFEAAYFGQEDKVNAVSDSIIMGIPIPLGTGIFKLLQKTEKKLKPGRTPLFDNPKYFDRVRD